MPIKQMLSSSVQASRIFQVFELGLLDAAHIVDSCQSWRTVRRTVSEKTIYDIPAYPLIVAQELVDRLLQQIEPFDLISSGPGGRVST
jgi:hypothetical protein